jgi:predicted ATP-dependent endonuclease of OLD family
MQLLSIKYNQFSSNERHWDMSNLEFEPINLLVGKNSSGKSKSLHVINGLSNVLLNSKLLFVDGYYELKFQHENKIIDFAIKYEDQKVITESLLIDQEKMIERGTDNKGFIVNINNVKDNFSWGTFFLNEHLRFRYDKIRGAPCIS